MAARKNPKITEAHREKIKTTQLINRLNKIGLGEVEATSVQMRAIEVALKKSVPDLQSIEHKGDDNTPLTVQIVRYADNKTTK